jgi:hypothetical protein
VAVLLLWVGPSAESVGFSTGSSCFRPISVWGLGHGFRRFLFRFWAFLSSVVLGFWPLVFGSTAIRPLPGLSLRPHYNKLQCPLHWSDSAVTRLAFPCIVGFFSLYFVVVSLYCYFLLVINPLLFDMLLGKKLRPDLWVVDVNIILAFGSRRKSHG